MNLQKDLRGQEQAGLFILIRREQQMESIRDFPAEEFKNKKNDFVTVTVYAGNKYGISASDIARMIKDGVSPSYRLILEARYP